MNIRASRYDLVTIRLQNFIDFVLFKANVAHLNNDTVSNNKLDKTIGFDCIRNRATVEYAQNTMATERTEHNVYVLEKHARDSVDVRNFALLLTDLLLCLCMNTEQRNVLQITCSRACTLIFLSHIASIVSFTTGMANTNNRFCGRIYYVVLRCHYCFSSCFLRNVAFLMSHV